MHDVWGWEGGATLGIGELRGVWCMMCGGGKGGGNIRYH